MMVSLRAIFALLALIPLVLSAQAEAATLNETLAGLSGAKSFPQIEAVVRELGASGDPAVGRALDALSEGNLYIRKSDGAVFIITEDAEALSLFDPLTGEAAGTAAKPEMTKIRVNNSLRRVIREVAGGLTLGADDPTARMDAANVLFARPDPNAIALLETAIGRETDGGVKSRLEAARAAAILVSDRGDGDKHAAIAFLGGLGNREALNLLTGFGQGRRDR